VPKPAHAFILMAPMNTAIINAFDGALFYAHVVIMIGAFVAHF